MNIFLLFARLLLAGVFTLAGLTKLLDLARWRQNLAAFGLPNALVPPFALLLPLAELAVAIALIPTAAAWWGAIGALGLLLLFGVAIGVNLARGRRPACHCFGQRAAGPIGWPTLARNVALAMVAGLLVWRGREDVGASAVAWLADLTAIERIALLGAAIAVGLGAATLWLLVHLLRQNGRLLLRLEALEARRASEGGERSKRVPAGQPPPEAVFTGRAPAPAFTLSDLDGQTQTLEALRAAGRPVLLTFTDPNCGPCDVLIPDVARWQREHAARLTVVLISRGSPKANRAKSGTQSLANVLLQRDREVSDRYEAHGTPSAVLVRADGTLGSRVAQGADAIRALVERAVARGRGLPVGSMAPEFDLPDLDGRRQALSQWRGRRIVLVFFNPRCSFCVEMVPQLAAWPASAGAGAPLPVVVTTGSAAANRALVEPHGIRGPVLLQEQSEVASIYEAHGTPTGYLIDEQGRIASELTTGARALLTLAGVATPSDGRRQPALRAPREREGAPNHAAM